MTFEAKPLREYLELEAQAKELRKQLGGQLRSARLSAGITQSFLAVNAGVSQPYVAAVEKGDKTPSSDTLERFINVMEGSTSGDSQDDGEEEGQ
jgi:predicted transcriptional regulator